jgi:hypothetical protein
MAVILKINEIPTSSLTVDSTQYTVDNTSITADRITIVTGASSSDYSILIAPREYAVDVVMEFYHELKETLTTISATTESVNGYMKVNFSILVVEGDSFELTIKNTNGKILWKGKAYATEQTDLQNYQFTPKNNNNDIIKI